MSILAAGFVLAVWAAATWADRVEVRLIRAAQARRGKQ